ncbi:MAG: hypothetical protein KatS3mg033_0721 [Thermonema sp.]|uniref:hypothetical protein n=1 Tax=Thermonema sp. TaxID=2231181 RepID=UPI0021DC9F1B|nr:hypothetical protein [Thermonema sp.]GIV38921.1 MAG: hypothetical protein KatS3mg033_0721 [Thermonema sp.]
MKSLLSILYVCCCLLFLPATGLHAQKLSKKDKEPKKRTQQEYGPFKGSKWRGDREPHRMAPPAMISQFRGPVGVILKEGDEQDLTTKYPQRIPYRVLKKIRQRAAASSKARANYRGTIKRNYAFERSRLRNNRRMAAYRGTIKLSGKLERFRQSNRRAMASYRGTIKVKRNRAKSYADRYTGTPKSATLSRYRDPRYTRKGRLLLPWQRKGLPNWQREKPPKLRYDRKENKIWAKPRPMPEAKPKEQRSAPQDGGE